MELIWATFLLSESSYLLIYIASWFPGMIIFHIFTQGYLSMKVAQEKYGGNFLGIMVRICNACIVALNISFFFLDKWRFRNFFLYSTFYFYFFWTVGETIEIGDFDPKIATFWIESGSVICLKLSLSLSLSPSVYVLHV